MFKQLTKDSVKAFLSILSEFDYYYSYSDDRRVYEHGRAQENQITDICKHPDFSAIFEAYKKLRESPVTLEANKAFEQRIQEILQKAVVCTVTSETDPQDCVESLVNPTAVLVKKSKEEEPFINAGDFLRSPSKAKEYLKKRPEDLAELLSALQWKSTVYTGAITTRLYSLEIYQDVGSDNGMWNKIVTKNSTLRYSSQVCMLAYVLAAFW